MRNTLRIAGLILVFGSLLFGSAGRLDWTAGWVFFGSYLLAVLAVGAWLKAHDPQLLHERRNPGEDAKGWDQVLMRAYSVVLLCMLVLASLDAGRFGWSRMPLWAQIAGFMGFTPAGTVILWAMINNTYLSRYVRIQEDRGHAVASEGPYQYVRHPMYAGVILLIVCVPLALGSCWALLPAGLIISLFIVRTALEDQTLQEELEGYAAYTGLVRYRLLPGLW